MRDEAPLYYNEKYDFYALTRYQDVLAAHLDPATYSSARTTVLEIMDAGWPDLEPPMIFMDPPDHTRFRKLVSRAFTPRHIGGLEPRVRELVADFLDPMLDRDGFDYVEDFGAKLPVMVITALLGAPREDEDKLREWSDMMLHREPGETGMSEQARAASSSMFTYWQR